MSRTLTGVFGVLSALVLTACGPAEETQKKDARHVETVVVHAAPVSETVSTSGEISARVQSDLSFKVSGRITERLVGVGDSVKSGQVLARIDPQEQKADLRVAMATLQSGQAQLAQAQNAFNRQQSLFNTGVTTRAALDEAQEGVLTGQATVQSAQAQLDSAQDALEQTELKADADGVITARSAEVGQVAQAAQAVFTLAHDGPRDAVINANESALLGREIEDEVEIRLISGGQPIAAKVREVSPTIDSTTGTIKVKLALQNAPNVRLGTPIVATARYKPMTTIRLPWSAMASDASHPAVWVVDPKTNAVSLRPVEIATYGSEQFSVRSGVSEGDIVVSNGTKFLSTGEIVAFEGAAK